MSFLVGDWRLERQEEEEEEEEEEECGYLRN
jgi:hypothetical protein